MAKIPKDMPKEMPTLTAVGNKRFGEGGPEPSYSPLHLVGSQLALASHLSNRRFVTGAKEKEGRSPSGGGPATGE